MSNPESRPIVHKFREWDDLQDLARKTNFRQPFIDESLWEYRMAFHMHLLPIDIVPAFEVKFRKDVISFDDDELLAMHSVDIAQVAKKKGSIFH